MASFPGSLAGPLVGVLCNCKKTSELFLGESSSDSPPVTLLVELRDEPDWIRFKARSLDAPIEERPNDFHPPVDCSGGGAFTA